MAGKENNSDRVSGALSSRKIFNKMLLLLHNSNTFARISGTKGLISACIDNQKAAEFVMGSIR